MHVTLNLLTTSYNIQNVDIVIFIVFGTNFLQTKNKTVNNSKLKYFIQLFPRQCFSVMIRKTFH